MTTNTEAAAMEARRELDKLFKAAEAKLGKGNLPVLTKGSDEWEAWRQWRVDHGLGTVLMDRRLYWTVPSLWPPGQERRYEPPLEFA